VCAEHAPLVELGGGAGHWQRALSHFRPRGPGTAPVDVLSYDDYSDIPLAVEGRSVGEVRRGGVEALRLPEANGRTLLLVYPPPGDMARRALGEHTGDTFIYVGEARGGYNADDSFFDALERGWRVKRVVPLRPFEGGFEKLYVLTRRHSWMRLSRTRAWLGLDAPRQTS